MGFVPPRQLRLILSAPAALFALLAILLWAATAAAQTAAAPATEPPPSSPAVSDQDIDQLTAVLADAAAREKLMAQLRALKAARAAGPQAPAPEAAAPVVVEPRGLGATVVTALAAKLKQLGHRGSACVDLLLRL